MTSAGAGAEASIAPGNGDCPGVRGIGLGAPGVACASGASGIAGPRGIMSGADVARMGIGAGAPPRPSDRWTSVRSISQGITLSSGGVDGVVSGFAVIAVIAAGAAGRPSGERRGGALSLADGNPTPGSNGVGGRDVSGWGEYSSATGRGDGELASTGRASPRAAGGRTASGMTGAGASPTGLDTTRVVVPPTGTDSADSDATGFVESAGAAACLDRRGAGTRGPTSGASTRDGGVAVNPTRVVAARAS